MRRTHLFGVLGLSLLLAGCIDEEEEVTEGPGDGSNSAPDDDSRSRTGDDPRMVPDPADDPADPNDGCGDARCGPGEYCCDAARGFCAPIGTSCGGDACERTSCEAQDAQGEGDCPSFHGYAFNGAGCVAVIGCCCAGADCGRLHRSRRGCEAQHTLCHGESCSCTH